MKYLKILHFKSIVRRVLVGYILAAAFIYITSYKHAHYLISTIIFDGVKRETHSQITAIAQKIDVQFNNLERDALALARHIVTTANNYFITVW